MQRKKNLFDLVIFALLFGILFHLTYDYNYTYDEKLPGARVFNADKSHYYIYLPATFIYGWDFDKFPYHIDKKYKGFIQDYSRKKIIIKVTYGVALLASPFFLVTHGTALISGVPADGFSEHYEKMGLIAPVFYLILGLFFLKRFLDRYFSSWISWLTVLIVFTGTNLYHYMIFDGWMSHVFSFFLFSLSLYSLKCFLDSGKKQYGKFILTAVAVSLAVLVRPTSILLLIWLVLLDVRSFREVGERIVFFLRPKYSVPFALIGILVFIPQTFYWHYLSGSYLFYSYPGETFMFWDRPNLIPVWFSPLNGLFFYTPLVFFMIAGIVMMIWKRIPNGLFIAFIFLLNSYLIASWHVWYFGGSYGCRPFVEYFALLSLPLAWMLFLVTKHKNLFFRSAIFLFILVTVFYNQRLIYHPRWNGSGMWAIDDFRDYLDMKGIQHFRKDSYTMIQDFENIGFLKTGYPTQAYTHSPTYACIVTPEWEYCFSVIHGLGPFLSKPVKNIEVSFWIDPFSSDSCGAKLVSTIEHDKVGIMMYRSVSLNSQKTKKGQWTKVETEIPIPLWMNDPEYRVRFYIWNVKKRHFLMDDLRISYRN